MNCLYFVRVPREDKVPQVKPRICLSASWFNIDRCGQSMHDPPHVQFFSRDLVPSVLVSFLGLPSVKSRIQMMQKCCATGSIGLVN